MKYGILVFLILLVSLSNHKSFSQTIQNEIVATAGNVYILENTEISWTLGESLTNTFLTENVMLSQGFHQPFITYFEINEKESPDFEVNIFPNPTKRYIKIELAEFSVGEKYILTISDIMGQQLTDHILSTSINNLIDLFDYAPGILLIRIIRTNDNRHRAFVIIRTEY